MRVALQISPSMPRMPASMSTMTSPAPCQMPAMAIV